MFLPSAPNTCHSTTAWPQCYSKTSYSTCPVMSGLLRCRAGRSSSFHAGIIRASPACSGTHHSGSQAAQPCDSSSSESCTGWRLPVTERIQYKLCLLVHKLLLEHTPGYISDLLTSVDNIQGWSTLHGNLVMLRTRWQTGDTAFSVAADGAETAAIDGLVSTWSENISVWFCLRALGYLLCDAPSVF